MVVILDNGHGKNTPGKCSPDKSILEYEYVRRVTAAIAERLRAEKYDVRILVPETYDVSLSERVRRANKIYAESGKNAFFVSVHLNAAGNGSWMSARGWSGFIARNASQNSKVLANFLYDSAVEEGLKVRVPSAGVKYWQQNFTVIAKTNCPAVLTENLFQDNKEDVALLNSEEGFRKIVNTHVNGIKKYISYKVGR